MASEQKHIIAPESLGMWVASTFIIALLALGVAVTTLVQLSNYTLVLETQILMLNKKIEQNKQGEQKPAEQQPAQQ